MENKTNDFKSIFEWGKIVGESENKYHFLYIPPATSCDDNQHLFKSRRKRRKVRIMECSLCKLPGSKQFRDKGKWRERGYKINSVPRILHDNWITQIKGV
jgi:hypothetical protein